MSVDVTRFRDLADLARLPWFSIEDGRLVLSDRSLPPAIDMHAHVALAYLLPMQVDLMQEHAQTQHYLPACCPLDLDVYVNKNFRSEDLAAMKRDLTLGSLTRGGMRETHTLANLRLEMAELRIERSVLLPIDLPALSHNAEVVLALAKKNAVVVPFGSVHPLCVDLEARLDRQLAAGARGIKVHPNVQVIRPDHPRAMMLYRLCGERGMIVLWHCGPVGIEPALGRYLSQVRWYEEPIAQNPRTQFVLGHSGALQMDEALRLQKTYPNVWLETSSQGLSNIRRIVREGDPKRVVFGTDWPFYHQAISLAKVLIATEGDAELRELVLRGNAVRLLGLPD
jgi:predicted TIM-barrel fold metal-dependent hydrolase